MRRRMGKCAFMGLVIYLILAPASATVSSQEDVSRDLQPSLSILMNESSLKERGYIQDGQIRIIANYSQLYEFEQISSLIKQLKGKILVRFERFNFISLEIPYTTLPVLEQLGLEIHLDRKFHACLDQSVPIIKPGAVWSSIETYFGYSINGSGITVAVLDTGIEDSHPDLDDLDDNDGTSDPKILYQESFVQGNTNPDDNNGHGTHVAGIIGGTGNESGGVCIGVAPGCFLLNGKVLDENGTGYESWIIAGIQWALDNNSDVINLSLATEESGNGTDPLSTYVDYAVSQGVSVILASGTTGSGSYKVGMPGVCYHGITVGNADGSSPWGPTEDFRLKPDLLAPGSSIDSCDDDASGYVSMSGSSQAAAHVSGAVALLLQTYPSWSPRQIKDTLISNAENLGLEPYRQGGGRIYIPSAINTSLHLTAIADFALFGPDDVAHQTINLTNLRPYPVTVVYNASKFAINLSSPAILPASSSVRLNVSINLTDYSTHRIWEYINFSVEGKMLHLIVCGIQPYLNLSGPVQSVLYNTSFNLTLSCDLDDAPIDFLGNSYVRLLGNASQVLAQIPITGNGTIEYPLRNESMFRGRHQITAELYINDTLTKHDFYWVIIQGYNSSISMADWSGVRHRELLITLGGYTNVSGPCYLYIYLDGAWVLVDEITTPEGAFQFQSSYKRGTHSMKVVFSGSNTNEPCEVIFTLTITLNSLRLGLLLLPLIAGLVIVVSTLFYRRRKKKLTALRRKIKETSESGRAVRNFRYLKRKLYLEKEEKGVVEEPGVLEEPEPDVIEKNYDDKN